ncbi:MAG TPA: hypothetical protein VGN73_10155 [Gemmatimonadaceae bacterium]|nr:hypothetical protein [Gemmatimonadaceae bacterium]
MLGQLPRFALATPVFRFRSLTAAAGRAALGGDRETLIACLQLGRLCAGILPPYELSREVTLERTENTKQWLASIAVPSGIRSTAFGIVGGLTGHDRARCALAFEDLVKAAFAQLDEASRVELNALIHELTSTPSAGTRIAAH